MRSAAADGSTRSTPAPARRRRRRCSAADATDTTNPFTALDGTDFGVDFNPVVDRLRVVSNTGQNLRINVDSGATITDGALNTAGATRTGVSAAAYTNSFASACRTTLFYIDTATDRLLTTSDPNARHDQRDRQPRRERRRRQRLRNRHGRGRYELCDRGAHGRRRNDALLDQSDVRCCHGNRCCHRTEQRRDAARHQRRVDHDGTGAGSGLGARSDRHEQADLVQQRDSAEAVHVGSHLRPAGERERLSASTRGRPTARCTPSAAPVASTRSTRTPPLRRSSRHSRADAADATNPFTALDGGDFGVDFNPVPDRLRVVSNTGQNLRINVDTGATTTDTDAESWRLERYRGRLHQQLRRRGHDDVVRVRHRERSPDDPGPAVRQSEQRRPAGRRPARHRRAGVDRLRHQRRQQRRVRGRHPRRRDDLRAAHDQSHDRRSDARQCDRRRRARARPDAERESARDAAGPDDGQPSGDLQDHQLPERSTRTSQ